MKERSDEIQRRASALHARRTRSAVDHDLRRLLGAAGPIGRISEGAEAAAVLDEFRSSYQAIHTVSSLLVHQEWAGDSREEIARVVDRFSAHLGARPSWLLLSGPNPLVLSVHTDDVLDNPFGFATLDAYQLRLLDRELPTGLWLLRHEHHGPGRAHTSIAGR